MAYWRIIYDLYWTVLKAIHLHPFWQHVQQVNCRCLTYMYKSKHNILTLGQNSLPHWDKIWLSCRYAVIAFFIYPNSNLIRYYNLFSSQLTICGSLWKKDTKTWERKNRTGQEASRCVGLSVKSLFLHSIGKQIWLQKHAVWLLWCE